MTGTASRRPGDEHPPLVAAHDVHKRLGRRQVLDGASLDARAGEAVAVVGENGAGKTTLLRICAGLLEPDAGRVDRRGRVGYCPQEPGLLELLTADEHLVLFGRALDLSRSQAIALGRGTLDRLGLRGEHTTLARDLSGGGRQKLNLALALLGEPEILLLDEPYQGFDHGTYVNFWDLVDEWRGEGRAVVVVTHLLAELGRVDRVVELSPPERSPAAAAEAPVR